MQQAAVKIMMSICRALPGPSSVKVACISGQMTPALRSGGQNDTGAYRVSFEGNIGVLQWCKYPARTAEGVL